MRRCESVVQQKRIQADGALSALQKEYTELEYHLRQIKSQPEPVPPRRESVQAARLQLMLRGVPCAPLYEIIDFSPETSQETRDLLEAQLLDSGLLDALVVSEEHLPAVEDLLEEYPDRFLVPGPAVSDSVTRLIPGRGRPISRGSRSLPEEHFLLRPDC